MTSDSAPRTAHQATASVLASLLLGRYLDRAGTPGAAGDVT